MKEKAAAAAKNISFIIFDVDGVLTDCSIYVGENGELFKQFNGKDGQGIVVWQQLGLRSAIITGRQSEMVKRRAEKLGITEVRQGNSDKRGAYRELKEKYGLKDEEIAYVGDDLIDLPVMCRAGLPVAVGDAADEVKEHALLVTEKGGGHGAVREAIEFILKAQGRWENVIKSYLE